MDRRYNILETEKVRDVESYHQNVLIHKKSLSMMTLITARRARLVETMPYIIIVIDELADIMQSYLARTGVGNRKIGPDGVELWVFTLFFQRKDRQ